MATPVPTAAAAETTDQPKAVKLPYFHRQLSAEELALIGNISPTPIECATAAEEAVLPSNMSSSAKWNVAQTWEERDVTAKAKDVLRATFDQSFGLSDATLATAKGYSVNIDSLENISGSANITHVRGKPRYFYDWSFDLIVDISSTDASKTYTCKLTAEDVVNDQLDDIELTINWTGVRPPNDQLAVVKDLLTGKKTMKHTLKTKMQLFEAELQKL